MIYRRNKRSVVDRALAEKHPYGPLNYLWERDVAPRLPRWRKRQDYGQYTERRSAALKRLSRGQQLILNLYIFTTEMSNGGLEQYFWNSSGDAAEELLLDLEELGAVALHATVSRARDQMFAEPVPTDIDRRRSMMEEFFGTHPFNNDDDKERLAQLRESDAARLATKAFYSLERDLVDRVREYVAKHRAEFGA